MPSCQIPWAIFQQICEKWNHTGLPEDVQNQRGQRMRMIHIVIMNIIQSDTDDNKVSVCAGFQSCLPCLSNVYIIYSLIQSNQSFYFCWVILSGVSCWHGFPFYRNTHKCTDWICHQPSSFDLTLWHVSQNTSFRLLTFVESSICLTQWSQSWWQFTWKLFINCYWYADHMHCPWINDALVTGHDTWLAYENYIRLTVTSNLHIYPILIN